MARPEAVERLFVGPERVGERLDKLLVEHLGDVSRSRIQLWIKEGRTKVEGVVCLKPGLVLERGWEIELVRPATILAEDLRGLAESLVLLHTDEHLLVFDKPAGMLVHPGEGGGANNLAALANLRFGPLPVSSEEDRPGVVHRLDRQTSGVIVLARTSSALAGLQQQFRERSVKKTYQALVHGAPRFESDWIEAPIGPDPRRRDRFVIVAPGQGREASTYYQVSARFPGLTWLTVRPKPGRPHQIRVHLCSIGLPLVGDHVYRPTNSPAPVLPPEAPALYRQALHALEIELTHPATGERVG